MRREGQTKPAGVSSTPVRVVPSSRREAPTVELDPGELRLRAQVADLARRIPRAYPRVAESTAEAWALSMLRRLPDVGRCAEVVLRAAESMDELSLHRLHRALDAELRPAPPDDSRALAAWAGEPTPEQRRETAVRAEVVQEILAGRVEADAFEAEVRRRMECEP